MEFGILGPLEIHGDGDRTVALGAGRQRAVLAALLLHENEVVSTDRLIDFLWGETSPESAGKALQVYVSQLRKALEPGRGRGATDGILATRPPGYVLRVEPGALDSHRFERLLAEGRRALAAGNAAEAAETLRKALALWRGPALAEFAFDAFAQSAIARLDELRLTALEERIESDLALGRHDELVGELEALVADHPRRERLRGQLMLALYRCGRQAEALEEYRLARRALVEELGLEPGEALQRLERAILAHDPALEAPEAAVGVSRPARHAATTGPNSVVRIDPELNRVVGSVPVGRRPVAVAVGHGSVWVANADDGTVSRIDPDSMAVVRTIGIAAAAIDLAIGPDSVWAANGSDGTVSRIDPVAEAVIETIVLRGGSDLLWNTTYAVAAEAAAVWIAVGPRNLIQVDPASGQVTATDDVGPVPVSVVISDGAIWVATMAGRALRIEPRSHTVTAEVPVGQPVAMAADGGAVWVADARGSLWCIDPHTAAVTQTIRVGRGPLAVAAEDGMVWAAESGDGTVVRVDPARGTATDIVAVGHSPTDVAIGAGGVWVAIQSADAS
jgi:DNA-binding SARP family transcriptional activator/DNA-binding beta-propeller fold protein YncE